MFKFLNFGPFRGKPAVESQRQSFERTVAELNSVIDTLAEKPRVTIDPATGNIEFQLPEQFPDEALGLPSPDAFDAETVEIDAEEPEAETAKAA